MLGAVLLLACGDDRPDVADAGDRAPGDAGDGPVGSWLDLTTEPLPDRLSEVGLFPDLDDPEAVDPRVLGYTPAHPLWSNGSRKARQVYLPGPVDTADPDHWVFPLGTAFFKTFYFGEDLTEPVETRIMRLGEDGWEYATYAWEGAEGIRTDGRSKAVSVASPDGPLEHELPGRLACRGCHESSPARVLGFRTLQLSHAVDGEGDFELTRLSSVLDDPPEPIHIDHPDPATRAVLGYLEGNCVGCHNGTIDGPNSTYDLSHAAALANLIDQPAMSSGTIAGTRVIPGDPDGSVLILSMLGQTDADPMPPLGVQRVDGAMIERIRRWIERL